MLTNSQAKKMSKSELISLIEKEAWSKDARFVKNGKKHVPDGYLKRLRKMSYAELTEEYNALCVES